MCNEYDYEGDMDHYQKQLLAKGITKDMLDMDNFIGLTARELQNIVDSARLVKKGRVMMWKIVGRPKVPAMKIGTQCCRDNKKLEFEVIDSFSNEEEAKGMLPEYRIQFGDNWILKVVEE